MTDEPDDRGPRSDRPRGERPAGGRPARAGGRPTGGRPGTGRPNDGRPERGKPAEGGAGRSKPAWTPRPTERAGGSRADKPDPKRLWTKGGAPARGDRDARERETPEDRDPFGIRSVRAHHEAPAIPDDVEPKQLDRVALNELKTLSKENAEGVAKHLVMAARLIESDAPLAHQHAISAARRAGRIGVVRETLAITAYATGDYGLALRELRTFRRITGRDDQLPMMVDSERGLGRPERALELGRSVDRRSLPVPVQVELAIAMSGARLDQGDADAALSELEIPQLDPTTVYSWSPSLFDAYATVLEELGREDEAEQWYARADIAADALEGEDDDTIDVVEEFDDDDVDAGSDADPAASGAEPGDGGSTAETGRTDD